MTIPDKITQKIGEVGGKLRVRSALNPALWLCALITLPLVYVISSMANPPVWLIITAVAPVSAAIIGFFFLLIFDRDKLQSEDYQIKKKSLELIQEKGQKFPISAPSIEAIANPQFKELSSGSGSREDKK